MHIMPPNLPWRELNPSENAGGYISIYLNDDLSKLPVRAVAKPGDTKADPNLETATYGLFSFCGHQLRSGIVTRRYPHLFFATSRKRERVLTGYYHIRWYAPIVSGKKSDFCLAADAVHFLDEHIPLTEIDRIYGTNLAGHFRNMRLISASECKKIISFINDCPDATSAYLDEIDRLERFNLKHGGYRYFRRRQTEKFSWELAKRHLRSPMDLKKQERN